jgi:DNA polymerase III epsilon subunit-like protein
MLTKKICVFDFETDGSNPLVCSPVQISAIIVDPVKLEIVEGSEFNGFCKPEVMESDANYKYETDIIDFHAKVKGCSQDEIYAKWREYPSQEVTWNSFVSYLEKYHCFGGKKKSMFSAPIAAGYNINRFDLKIIQRLSEKYKNVDNKEKTSTVFYPRDVIDIMNLVFYWFESQGLKSYSLDSVRDYLGISKEGAHDALKDVQDCAKILIRFMKLHRRLVPKIVFKDSFFNDDSI